MGTDTAPTVLVVDDDEDLLTMYCHFLEDQYAVITASSGPEALDRLDGSVDLVLLDRRMPEMTGDEVLVELRERGYDGPVTMVTAVEPDTDIVELGFDDYLVKPVTREELRELVRTMLRRMAYDEVIRDHFALASKVAVLEEQRSREELRDHEPYRELTARLGESRAEAQARLTEMTEEEIGGLFRHIGASGYLDDATDRSPEED